MGRKWDKNILAGEAGTGPGLGIEAERPVSRLREGVGAWAEPGGCSGLFKPAASRAAA